MRHFSDAIYRVLVRLTLLRCSQGNLVLGLQIHDFILCLSTLLAQFSLLFSSGFNSQKNLNKLEISAQTDADPDPHWIKMDPDPGYKDLFQKDNSLFSAVQFELRARDFFLQFLVDILPVLGSGSRMSKCCGSNGSGLHSFAK